MRDPKGAVNTHFEKTSKTLRGQFSKYSRSPGNCNVLAYSIKDLAKKVLKLIKPAAKQAAENRKARGTSARFSHKNKQLREQLRTASVTRLIAYEPT